MKSFQFKQFSIQQSAAVFRVGTDGVVLGAAASVNHAIRVLEVGTGTGLISLMIAQRNHNAEISAIDINQDAVEIAKDNFKRSPFADRLTVSLQDYREFTSEMKYDLVISNPPYFEENPSNKDVVARQQTDLSFESLIEKSANILTDLGLLSVIIPFESALYFEQSCNRNKLYLQKKILIYGMKNSKPKRLVLEFGFHEKEIVESELVIEKSPRKFTDQYLKITEEFHQFTK